jgi:hypothetical protein
VSLVEAAMSAACSAADEADLDGGKRPGRMPPCARFHAYWTFCRCPCCLDGRADDVVTSLVIEDAPAYCACAVHAGKIFLSPSAWSYPSAFGAASRTCPSASPAHTRASANIS